MVGRWKGLATFWNNIKLPTIYPNHNFFGWKKWSPHSSLDSAYKLCTDGLGEGFLSPYSFPEAYILEYRTDFEQMQVGKFNGRLLDAKFTYTLSNGWRGNFCPFQLSNDGSVQEIHSKWQPLSFNHEHITRFRTWFMIGHHWFIIQQCNWFMQMVCFQY